MKSLGGLQFLYLGGSQLKGMQLMIIPFIMFEIRTVVSYTSAKALTLASRFRSVGFDALEKELSFLS